MSTRATDFQVAALLAHVKPLETLAEKIRPAHTALLVIDMQNDFCATGGLVQRGGRDVTEAQEMAKRLPSLIAAGRAAGVLVVFVRSVYSTERNLYLSDVWLEQAARKQGGGYTRFAVCADGSWEGDFYGEIRPAPGDVIVTKHRYSAFHNTPLDSILKANGIRTVVLTGVSTNVCVETTAREGFVRDYYVAFVRDGTAAYTLDEHEATLKTIDRFFGEIPSVTDILQIWRRNI